MTQEFLEVDPRPEDYWRGIILFGRNVASYKFALAQALLELQPAGGDLIRLEELAVPYAKYICSHLRDADKQGTFSSSRFLDTCRLANSGEVTQEELVEQTVRLGFNYVIDAFHLIGSDEVPVQFYESEKEKGGIRITDTLSELLESQQGLNLPIETEARWRLVETAWELGVSPGILSAVEVDPVSETIFVPDPAKRRREVTSARAALSGYQKGFCFYCIADLALGEDLVPDVDHFFPHRLKSNGIGAIVDGVWNLVLSCRNCNRGPGGKFDRIPTLRLLERLSTRNEFLIASHHPLRETLMRQTGKTAQQRHRFLAGFYHIARTTLTHEWEPQEVMQARF